MLRGTHVSTRDLIRLRGQTQGLVLPNNPAAIKAGGLQSLILGRGMDYEKSRKYEAGDDVRMIDWRVTARTGTAHTKVFQEDRQRAVYLVVDLSASMRFGTRVAFKSVVAAQAAALIAWASYSKGDLVSVIGVSDQAIRHFKLAATTDGLIKHLDMLATLSRVDSTTERANSTPMMQALSVVVKKIRTGDLAVVLTDFSDLSDKNLKALKFLSRRQALITCWIQDPIERQALPAGRYPVTDGNSYTTLHLSSAARRGKLQAVLDQRNKQITETLRKLDAAGVQLQCGDDVVKELRRAFHTRKSVGRGTHQTRRGKFAHAYTRTAAAS